MSSVSQAIARASLSPAERRAAEVVLTDPEAVAFGTVASVARRAATSGPTVVRMAAKAGFGGFAGLQAAVQEELARRLRPAAERIREPVADPLQRALHVELANVRETLEGVDRRVFGRAVRRLADLRRRVGILSGDATAGVARMLADALGMLREGVELVSGPQVRVVRSLAFYGRRDVLVAIDVRRYERWVLEAVREAVARGVGVVAVTDSLLSPLAAGAVEVFVVAAEGAGPFDSHTGTLALANALVGGVASRLRREAAHRLDRIESAWSASGALVGGG